MPREFLLFRLSGPLASWGEIAVGERRSSWPRPSKSAVLGLVAAALGYDRHDASAHASLNDGLHFAVRVDTTMRGVTAGSSDNSSLKPLRDYHTAQVPSARRGKKWATRAEELHEGQLNTILSERWYWTNMTATAAVWWKEGGAERPPLAEIEAALREPVFALYLGRKSCPLARPLNPERVSADCIANAFRLYDDKDATAAAKALPGRNNLVCSMIYQALATKAGRDIWADFEATAESEREETYSRRDAIRDRRSWTFSDRAEARIEARGSDVSVAG